MTQAAQLRDAAALAWATGVRMPWRVLRRAWARYTGRPVPLTEDRRVLEHVILPHYAARADVAHVLLVGTCAQSAHYPALLAHAGRRCTTIDIDPRAARYGSAQQHIIGDVAALHQFVAAGSVDVIICNGVYGWGLDTQDQMQRALRALQQVMRPGGELLIGWNDVPGRRPFALSGLPQQQGFEACSFAPLGTDTLALDTDNRHRYAFFQKPLR